MIIIIFMVPVKELFIMEKVLICIVLIITIRFIMWTGFFMGQSFE